jgi:chorismate dehydratase
MERIELVEDYPSKVAQMLIDGSIDIGLVPVAILPQLPDNYIYTDYCIGSDGPVASVCLFSEVPLEKIETVLLDYQSRTSVALAKILMSEYWKIEPRLADTTSDYRHAIKGSTAGILIGDRALQQRNISPYIYDLGEAWKNFSGMPFIYAAWVGNKKLPDDFVSDFNEANKIGLQHIDEVVAQNSFPAFDLRQYYTRYISYDLDEKKRKGSELFLRLLTDRKSHPSQISRPFKSASR